MRPKETKTTMPVVAALLGGFGVIPFVIGAVLANIPEIHHMGITLLLGYGAVILSFLGGIQWGLGLRAEKGASFTYIVSNLIALVAWAGLLASPPNGLLILGAGFVAALVFDMSAQTFLQSPPWFLRLRILLTGTVLLAIAVAYISF